MTQNESKKNCSNCNSNCSSCRQYQEKAFELEVDEELEHEHLTQLWEKYRFWIIGGVVGILLLTAGIQIYRSWWQDVRLKESDLYEESVILLNNQKFEDAQKGLEKLALTAHTGYKTLAQLQLSYLFVQQNKMDKAFEILEQVIQSTPQKDPFYHIAVLSYTGNKTKTEEPQKILDLLSTSLSHPQFQGLATEIAVPLLIKQNKKIQAKELIQKALQNQNISNENRARLNTLLFTTED